MIWTQSSIQLAPRAAGMHLITDDVTGAIDGLQRCSVGLLHLFLQHSSASLAINENADPDVRGDLQRHLDVLVPRNQPHYRHTLEGPDDMPAHIKSVLIGESLTIPVTDGRLALGTWQGIYLCEHRDRGGARNILATLHGEEAG